ncbi:Rotatin [Camponotus japonicus]
MLATAGITAIHVKKLGHTIDEIRLRALDNIISKYDLGFVCDCDAVKKEIIQRLFNWFSFEVAPQPEKVLNLLLRLAKTDAKSYLNAFGKLKFQNELYELRRKLSSEWYAKLDEIEEAVIQPERNQINGSNINTKDLAINAVCSDFDRHKTLIQNHTRYKSKDYEKEDHDNLHDIFTLPSVLDSTIPLDVTSERENGTQVSETIEGGIKWLIMPWQPLVTSDKGVLTAVEEALNNTIDINHILHTCQFITNVMMQDFPAEVFLQRPAIVMILHGFLKSSTSSMSETNVASVVPTVLRTLRKLTRSLKFRIYYYCEPCVANKKQKLLASKLDSNVYTSSEAGDGPDGGFPEANYQAYQSTGTSDRSQSISENVDDSVLQLQQMLLPVYCIESLKHVLNQLSLPIDSTFPLRNIKYITDLSHELVQLLIISIMPNIWLCNDDTALKISDDLKALFNLMGEVMEYFENCSNVDYLRITYLHLTTITMKLLSSIVPLELADTVIPNSLKTSIASAIMDAPIYLLYPALHSMLLEYTRQFQGVNQIELVKLFDETKTVTKSMQAAISVLKGSLEQSPSETLRMLYTSKLSLSYHKNLTIVKIAVKFLQDISKYSLSDEDYALATKLTLNLLANGDINVQHATYVECHILVKSILGVEYNKDKLSWKNLMFLLEPNILTEIISHGAISENKKINEVSRDMIVFILKGRIQMGETGWLKTLEAFVPVLYLLQCHADTNTVLGQCVTKIFDPDVSNSIQLPFIEVLKGNLRFLYSPNSDIREEALCRLIWLLGKEKDSVQKLPRLSSLHGLPLSSLCIFERKISVKRSEGNYQRSNLLSVLEMLNEPNVDPKIRKSALVQISVMLSDTSLHKLFINQGGLPLILDIFSKALIEKDYINYPDSVIPIISILKLLVFFECSVRHELSISTTVLFNIIRSLFLFPNNECIKTDGAQLLCLLLYSEHIIRVSEKATLAENSIASHISLPYIVVANMKLPFACKSHWKTSLHRRSDVTLLHGSNPVALTFIRQYWAWEWNDGINMLWKSLDDIQNSEVTQKLIILEKDFLSLQYSFSQYCCQQQLYNIQNSTAHYSVTCALDYLTMYLKFYKILQRNNEKEIDSLPWEQTFERFLLSHPASKEDCDLFVDVLIFLQLYLNVAKKGKGSWISKIMKNMTRSLADLFKNLEVDNQNVHQSILKLVRTCSAIEKMQKSNGEPKNTWIKFVEFVVLTLCFGDQQHFYNLAYLDWLLTCLTYLIGQCEWGNHKNLLLSLCNTLIEPIVSFHGAGTVSFMGLSITRNSIICLNHLLHQMQVNFNKSSWVGFWHEEGRSLNVLPMLWQNRDPLVRASALQLLAGLMNTVHTVSQLLNAIAMAPSDLCHTLLQCIANREESCLVREQACIAFCNMLKNSMTYQCDDSLQSQAVLIYVEQCNIYHEIGVLCSNIYILTTLDAEQLEYRRNNGKPTFIQSAQSGCFSLVPRIVSYLYNCQDELQAFSGRDSEITDVDSSMQSIATPSLITAACNLLNNLIFIGLHEVVRQIYEHSIDKYLFGCLNEIPKDNGKNLSHYSDVLEMYISICTVLINCITHSNEYSAVVLFSSDSLYTLFRFLNIDLYQSAEPRLMYLRNRLWTEIYNFIAMLSLTEDQHFEAIQSALELCGPEIVMASIYFAIKDSATDLRMSAIGCLAFLLSQEIQKVSLEKSDVSLLRTTLDTILDTRVAIESKDGNLRDVISSVNKLSIRDANVHSKKSNESEKNSNSMDKSLNQDQITIGGELCGLLLHLFIAHNYAKSKKNCKQSEDKDLIVGALTNLLYVSKEAKRVALQNDLPETALMILKELYVKLNLQPFELYKKQIEKKTHPLLHDINCIFILLMNFMYGDANVKETLTKKGLADVVHKLWAWIALNKMVSTSALKLLATFTTKCNVAAQSLTLTTILPGTGLRKTPNTLALIHVIIQVASKEIERAGQIFDNHKMHFAFHILRNAVHVHECRVCISKSNLLQFFTKIHPIITKRIKPWPLVEMYCLEFLIDFTYYEEGQLCVPKAIDALDVLIHLAKCSSSSSKVLAISILRNLAFNITNRPRLLSSVDFINLLHDIFKNGSSCEINLAGSMLWSLISNNQKGKLIARSAGFSQSIREALGRFTLSSIDASKQEQELVKVLQYVLTILSPVEVKNGST